MQNTNQFVRKWLVLAVSSITGAGIYSLPPVIFRGPFFKDILPVEAIFASSLVIHVDLSVLVWMLAIGGMLWSQFACERQVVFYKYAFYTVAAGMVLMAVSPLTGNLYPLKNNYIPVLQSPVFFMGLSLFSCGIVLQALLSILNYKSMATSPTGFGLNIAAVIVIIAFICFVIAAFKSGNFDDADPQSFYEFLFWGGGHILQFSYTTLLIVAWFLLLEASGYRNILPKSVMYIIFAINVLACLPSPLFYLADDSAAIFASHMRMFPGISPLIAGAGILYAMLKFGTQHTKSGTSMLKPFLVLSILLFGYGGVLAFMISGVNVTIPAHYHGSIVGISIAFMGLVYLFLPRVGFSSPVGFWAKSQPFIYGIGQAMHITGLAVMGGYGALRKDAASSQHIDTMLGKSLFFSGGSLAIIGGFIFVIVVFSAMRKGGFRG